MTPEAGTTGPQPAQDPNAQNSNASGRSRENVLKCHVHLDRHPVTHLRTEKVVVVDPGMKVKNFRDHVREVFDLEKLGCQISWMKLYAISNGWHTTERPSPAWSVRYDMLGAQPTKNISECFEVAKADRVGIIFHVRDLREYEDLWECRGRVHGRESTTDTTRSQTGEGGGDKNASGTENTAIEDRENFVQGTRSDTGFDNQHTVGVRKGGNGGLEDIAENESAWNVDMASERTSMKKGHEWKVVKARKKETSRDKAGKWEKVKTWEEVTTFRRVYDTEEESVVPAPQTQTEPA